MSSFSCPHIDPNSFCTRLKVDCIPGRSGCVLNKKVSFAIPAEERINKMKGEKKPTNKNTFKRK